MTRQEFESRLKAAHPGEKIIYHFGNLMRDRKVGGTFGVVDDVAYAAWKACEEGTVDLVQRRVAHMDVFDYVAVKRKPPYEPVVWMGCYDPTPHLIRKGKKANV